jgi:hypothetical protein
MWLAVLFVGVLGADIVSSAGPGGSTSSVPVVVVLLPFVLPATIVAARRGFTSAPGERPVPADEDARAHGEPTALRANPA